MLGVTGTLLCPKGGSNLFAIDLYEGTGAEMTIRNGVDLDLSEGMVWTKARSAVTAFKLTDTIRTATKSLMSDVGDAEATEAEGVKSFNAYGYVLGTDADYNAVGETFVGWTFREKPGFFDIVTYTGSGVARTVAHSLGVVPGMILVKNRGVAGSWYVYHRSNTAGPETDYLLLDTTAATADLNTVWNDTAPTSSVFTVGTLDGVNKLNDTFVAYLFGHSTDGIVQCGTYTGNNTTQAVSLGWQPRWVLVKDTSAVTSWMICDSLRTSSSSGVLYQDMALTPSAAAIEVHLSNKMLFTSTGFTVINGGGAATDLNDGSATYVYVAIRA
jgi:hypothetical protein